MGKKPKKHQRPKTPIVIKPSPARFVKPALWVAGTAVAGTLFVMGGKNSQQEYTPSVDTQTVATTAPTLESIAQISGVESIYSSRGDIPDVIYIMQSHASPHDDVPSGIVDTTIEEVVEICTALYDNFGSRTLIWEGIIPAAAAYYNSHRNVNISTSNSTAMRRKQNELTELLFNSRRWNMVAAERKQITAQYNREIQPLYAIRSQYVQDIVIEAERLNALPDADSLLPDQVLVGLEAIRSDATDALSALLTDEKVKRLYDLAMTIRTKLFSDTATAAAKTSDGPVIVVLGARHTDLFLSQMGDLNYAAIAPRGLPIAPSFDSLEDYKKSLLYLAETNVGIGGQTHILRNGPQE